VRGTAVRTQVRVRGNRGNHRGHHGGGDRPTDGLRTGGMAACRGDSCRCHGFWAAHRMARIYNLGLPLYRLFVTDATP
jgi:hypothetical protein